MELVGDVLQSHAFSKDVPGSLPMVKLDQALIEQALANLLLNAAMHTPSGSEVMLHASLQDKRLTLSVLDRGPGLPLLVFAQPGANSLAVENEVLSTMKILAKDFPAGVDYKIVYDPTIFVGKSVNEVIHTIFIAILLVVMGAAAYLLRRGKSAAEAKLMLAKAITVGDQPELAPKLVEEVIG